MYIALPPGSTVGLRKAGKQRKTGDAWEFVPETRNETRSHFGDLNETAMRQPLFGGEFGMSCRRSDGVGISERVAGGPKKGLPRQSLGWLMGLHIEDRAEGSEPL